MSNSHEETDDTKTAPDDSEDERQAQARYVAACTKLTNWGAVLTGRLVGQIEGNPKEPRAKGWRELFDLLLLVRAETNAIVGALILKGLVSEAELRDAIGHEAEALADRFEKNFPGIRALSIPNALHVYDKNKFIETTEGWPQ
jgi:hypothetical protein